MAHAAQAKPFTETPVETEAREARYLLGVTDAWRPEYVSVAKRNRKAQEALQKYREAMA
jgi:hypothetical protein